MHGVLRILKIYLVAGAPPGYCFSIAGAPWFFSNSVDDRGAVLGVLLLLLYRQVSGFWYVKAPVDGQAFVDEALPHLRLRYLSCFYYPHFSRRALRPEEACVSNYSPSAARTLRPSQWGQFCSG